MSIKTMRGWGFKTRGTPAQVLKLYSDLPQPTESDLKPDEVLVKITHAAVFAPTALFMSIIPHFNSNLWIPEGDFAGVAEAVGSEVADRLAPGDAVCGCIDPQMLVLSKRYNGAAVEYAIFPSRYVVKKPSALSAESSAGMGSNGCTAVQFVEQAKIYRGARVLITGGSGGLGSTLVQVAKAIVGPEGTIISTCSGSNVALVEGLGADSVIDYTEQPNLPDYLQKNYSSQPFDAIIDIVGSDFQLYDKCSPYLKQDGTFIFGGTINATHATNSGIFGILNSVFQARVRQYWPTYLGGVPRRGIFYTSTIDLKSLQEIAALAERGEVQILVDRVYEIEDLVLAYERVVTARARGKVILHIQDP